MDSDIPQTNGQAQIDFAKVFDFPNYDFPNFAFPENRYCGVLENKVTAMGYML